MYVTRILGAVFVTAGVAVAPPAAAAEGPGFIGADEGRHLIVYENPGNRVNSPTISVASSGTDPVAWIYTLHDLAPITAANGCSHPDPADETTVTCVLHEIGDFTPRIQLWLGPGDDTIDVPVRIPGLEVHGGGGDDTLKAIHFGVVYGDSGDDVLVGRRAYGGTGSDRIRARFADGGPGDDTIVGNDDARFRDDLRGGSGVDLINGRGGDDTIYGNAGNDVIIGEAGDDRLSGGPGDDLMYGDEGDDVLLGGAGRDDLQGGPGNDVLRQ